MLFSFLSLIHFSLPSLTPSLLLPPSLFFSSFLSSSTPLSQSIFPSFPLSIYLAFYPSSPPPFLKRQPHAFRAYNIGLLLWTVSPRLIVQSREFAMYLPSIRKLSSPFRIWLNFKKVTTQILPYLQIYTYNIMSFYFAKYSAIADITRYSTKGFNNRRLQHRKPNKRSTSTAEYVILTSHSSPKISV